VRKLACVLAILALVLLSMGSNVVIILKKPAAAGNWPLSEAFASCASWTTDYCVATGTWNCTDTAGSLHDDCGHGGSKGTLIDLVRATPGGSSGTDTIKQFAAVQVTAITSFAEGVILRSPGGSTGWRYDVVDWGGTIFWMTSNGNDDNTSVNVCKAAKTSIHVNGYSIGARITGTGEATVVDIYYWASGAPPSDFAAGTTNRIVTCGNGSTHSNAVSNCASGWTCTAQTDLGSNTSDTAKGIGIGAWDNNNEYPYFDNFVGGDW
jgi:hypothetical protein